MDNLFQIMEPEVWAEVEAAGVSTVSSRGLGLDEVGFIHACFAHQVDAVIDRYYADSAELVVAEIDPEQVTAEIRVEAAGDGSGDYPHIYGPLNLDAVIGTETRRL